MEKNKKSENYSLFDELKKWSPIFFWIVLAAIILSVLMVAIAKLIPGAKLFLMDKDGYYNVTLIGTLIAGMALVINTIELERKTKEEREQYDKDRIDERERFNRETRRQIEKDRMDRIYRAFFNYYKVAYELVEGYDELIVCLQGIERLEDCNSDYDILLTKKKYTKRFYEALYRVNPTYKSRIRIAGSELCWQIPDEADSDSGDEQSLGTQLKNAVEALAGGVQGFHEYDVAEGTKLLKKTKESIVTFKSDYKEIKDYLKETEVTFQNYVNAIPYQLLNESLK